MRTYCFTKPICILLILIGQPKHYGHAKKISEQHQWLGESSGEVKFKRVSFGVLNLCSYPVIGQNSIC